MTVAQRTTLLKVEKLLGEDYSAGNELQTFIDSATVIVDRVRTCAINKGTPLSTTELELVERWLSAHLYTKSDPTYSSKSTMGASGSFIRSPETPEPYKDGAINVDYSGCLKAILNRQSASTVWLGKAPSAQTDYEDRD